MTVQYVSCPDGVASTLTATPQLIWILREAGDGPNHQSLGANVQMARATETKIGRSGGGSVGHFILIEILRWPFARARALSWSRRTTIGPIRMAG